MPVSLVRSLLITLLVLLSLPACRVAEYTDDIRVAVQPRTLKDDGSRARVVVSVTDRYGEAGVGKVHVQSSAGSLREGLDLVLRLDGTVETELTCEAKSDPACADHVMVWAIWTSPSGDSLRKDVDVTIQTTDAFVSACAFMNRRVLKYLTGAPPRLQLAVLDTQPEIATSASGVALWDAKGSIGAVALTVPQPAGTLTAENGALLAAIAAQAGAVGNPLEQTFTTWDGYAAVRTTFDLGATGDVKAALQSVATALGGGPIGLSGSAGKVGPFKAELVAVRHGAVETAVVIALAPTSGFGETARFDLEDVAGGSAVALALDGPSDHCEIFTVQSGKKVDFLWVVDDSCSMASSQNAVARVGTQAATRIEGAQLDFRAGGVSTGWFAPSFAGSLRDWTVVLPGMLGWFRTNSPTSWGTTGSGDERGFDSLSSLFDTEVGRNFRTDSEVHVIFLTDTRDHSATSADEMFTKLTQRFPNQHVVVSGIICPEKDQCGDDPELVIGKYHTLIRRTGGVLGSIKVFNPPAPSAVQVQQQADTINRIAATVINGAGYPLQYKPITASVRVAASGVADARCDNRDIPRSTVDGWDLDPSTGRMAFYGRCIPTRGGTMVVSYKSWVRNGTVIHETTTPTYAVVAPDGGSFGDGGVRDAGTADAGRADAGVVDAGAADAGDADAGDGG